VEHRAKEEESFSLFKLASVTFIRRKSDRYGMVFNFGGQGGAAKEESPTRREILATL